MAVTLINLQVKRDMMIHILCYCENFKEQLLNQTWYLAPSVCKKMKKNHWLQVILLYEALMCTIKITSFITYELPFHFWLYSEIKWKLCFNSFVKMSNIVLKKHRKNYKIWLKILMEHFYTHRVLLISYMLWN